MILAKRVGVLYDRCSSIEIKDFRYYVANAQKNFV